MKIIAHRANDNINKENSIKGVLNSLSKYYVDGIEIDVRLTKDKKFVLNHDPFYEGHYIKFSKSSKLNLDILDNVLESINSKKIIMIEVKVDDNIKKTSKEIYKVISKYNLNIYLCSFNYNFIKLFHKKYPHIICGLIIGTCLNKNHINNDFNFNSINYKYNINKDKKTFIWTVNNVKNIKKSYGIITDNPKKIYEFINEKKV